MTLEAIEIEQDERDGIVVVGPGPRQRMAHPVEQQRPVRQAREAIVEGRPAQLGFEPPPLAEVADRDDVGRVAVRVGDLPPADLDRERRSVGVLGHDLERGGRFGAVRARLDGRDGLRCGEVEDGPPDTGGGVVAEQPARTPR